MCVFVDCERWTYYVNTNVGYGERVSSANTVTACQQACLNNASCTGIDFNPYELQRYLCWMSGPWSGRRNQGFALGIVHYDLDRNCVGGNVCKLLKQHSHS